ncbi:MAG: Asp-tRNA(Asn)/Glu-tRNA(Gln) amidotransferase subunit GatB, partial [Nanoarchaeota archaeon]|nr:Asp-tRNA(Asn)/Glu-tRNA(Gln) amidotransferase subunit GatB [Nanoarchaeota archaeon]
GENLPPNTSICPVCLAHPGTLPVANEQAIEWSAKTALALNCTVNEYSKFDRKNYFYPDLPKGYQISQYDQPIGSGGYLVVQIPDAPEGNRKEARVRLNRLHLEEDAAKLVHTPDKKASLVDYNRSSTPLMEIVTEPDLSSPQEAKAYLQELRTLVRHLDVSTADMEKGHLRCDANVSIKFEHDGQHVWTPISEIKNLNSFKAVERALEYEGNRLYQDWLSGGDTARRSAKITVGWDDEKSVTILQRGKEEAHDYRYFPEPDLPPLRFTLAHIEKLRSEIPELPIAKRVRFIEEYGVSASDARMLTDEKDSADYFEKAVSELQEWLRSKNLAVSESQSKGYKLLSGWMINKAPAILSPLGQTISTSSITPEDFAEFITLLLANEITSTSAQVVLEEMVKTGAQPHTIVSEKGLQQVSDVGLLESACNAALAANPDAVVNYKAGKTTVIMFLVGQVMKEMKGKAQPEMVKKILEKKLQS